MHLTSYFFGSRKRSVDLKDRTVHAMSVLEVEIKAMHALSNILQTGVNNSLISAMKSEYRQESTQHIEEYNELVNLLNIVKSAELLLSNFSSKIESARYVQEFANIMDSAIYSIQMIKSDMSRIVPALNSHLDRISSSMQETKSELGLMNKVSVECQHVPELPLTTSEHLPELPRTAQGNPKLSAINLTTFTTAVHTQV